jgi:hypothetical protein
MGKGCGAIGSLQAGYRECGPYHLRPRRWRQHVSPKRYQPKNPHSAETKDFFNMIIIAIITSNLTVKHIQKMLDKYIP